MNSKEVILDRILFYSIILCVFTIAILSWIELQSNVFHPAEMSTLIDCSPVDERYKVAEQQNVTISGMTTATIRNNTIIDVNVTIINKSIEILKHEYVHVKQLKRGKLITCSNLNDVYRSEIEAYMSQYEPMWLYRILYLD